MKTISALLICVALLCGCSTQYRPFQVFGTGGYAETPISSDSYRVTYYGNHLTSMETLSSLLLYRCAELTTKNGFDNFEIIKGYGQQPLSALGGFRTLEYTIRMSKGTPASPGKQTYVASDVKQRFGTSIGK